MINFPTSASFNYAGTNDLYLGTSGVSGDSETYYPFSVDELKIYNIPLSSMQVQTAVYQNVWPDISLIVFYANFEEGAGAIVDHSIYTNSPATFVNTNYQDGQPFGFAGSSSPATCWLAGYTLAVNQTTNSYLGATAVQATVSYVDNRGNAMIAANSYHSPPPATEMQIQIFGSYEKGLIDTFNFYIPPSGSGTFSYTDNQNSILFFYLYDNQVPNHYPTYIFDISNADVPVTTQQTFYACPTSLPQYTYGHPLVAAGTADAAGANCLIFTEITIPTSGMFTSFSSWCTNTGRTGTLRTLTANPTNTLSSLIVNGLIDYPGCSTPGTSTTFNIPPYAQWWVNAGDIFSVCWDSTGPWFNYDTGPANSGPASTTAVQRIVGEYVSIITWDMARLYPVQFVVTPPCVHVMSTSSQLVNCGGSSGSPLMYTGALCSSTVTLSSQVYPGLTIIPNLLIASEGIPGVPHAIAGDDNPSLTYGPQMVVPPTNWLSVQGPSAYVQSTAPNAIATTLSDHDFTICFWLLLTSWPNSNFGTQTMASIFSLGGTTSVAANQAFSILIDTSGVSGGAQLHVSYIGYDCIAGDSIRTLNVWHHICLVTSSKTNHGPNLQHTFYVNAQSLGTANTCSTTNVDFSFTNPTVTIGSHFTDGGQSLTGVSIATTVYGFTGGIAQLYIWNRILTSAEVKTVSMSATTTSVPLGNGNIVASYVFLEGGGSSTCDTSGTSNGPCLGTHGQVKWGTNQQSVPPVLTEVIPFEVPGSTTSWPGEYVLYYPPSILAVLPSSPAFTSVLENEMTPSPSTSYIARGNASLLIDALSNSDFTVSIYLMFTQPPQSHQVLFSLGNCASFRPNECFTLSTTSTLGELIWDYQSNPIDTGIPAGWFQGCNIWHQYVLTVSSIQNHGPGAARILYVNGVPVNSGLLSADFQPDVHIAAIAGDRVFTIGGPAVLIEPYLPASGIAIDGFYIFHTTLAADDVYGIWSVGNPLHTQSQSGNNFNCIAAYLFNEATGTMLYDSIGLGAPVLQSGVAPTYLPTTMSAYIVMPAGQSNVMIGNSRYVTQAMQENDFTVLIWAYRTIIDTGEHGVMTLFTAGDCSTPNPISGTCFYFGITNSNYFTAGGWNLMSISSGVVNALSLSVGTWILYSVEWQSMAIHGISGSSVQVFINGNSIGMTNILPTKYNDLVNWQTNIYSIGGPPSLTTSPALMLPWVGGIGPVHIYNVPVDISLITPYYNTGQLSLVNLLVSYRWFEQSGTVCFDSANTISSSIENTVYVVSLRAPLLWSVDQGYPLFMGGTTGGPVSSQSFLSVSTLAQAVLTAASFNTTTGSPPSATMTCNDYCNGVYVAPLLVTLPTTVGYRAARQYGNQPISGLPTAQACICETSIDTGDSVFRSIAAGTASNCSFVCSSAAAQTAFGSSWMYVPGARVASGSSNIPINGLCYCTPSPALSDRWPIAVALPVIGQVSLQYPNLPHVEFAMQSNDTLLSQALHYTDYGFSLWAFINGGSNGVGVGSTAGGTTEVTAHQIQTLFQLGSCPDQYQCLILGINPLTLALTWSVGAPVTWTTAPNAVPGINQWVHIAGSFATSKQFGQASLSLYVNNVQVTLIPLPEYFSISPYLVNTQPYQGGINGGASFPVTLNIHPGIDYNSDGVTINLAMSNGGSMNPLIAGTVSPSTIHLVPGQQSVTLTVTPSTPTQTSGTLVISTVAPLSPCPITELSFLGQNQLVFSPPFDGAPAPLNSFDSGDHHIALGCATSGYMVIQFWAQRNSSLTTGQNAYIFDYKEFDGNDGNTLASWTTDRIFFGGYNENWYTTNQLDTQINVWSHYVLVANQPMDTLSVYQNGVLIESGNPSNNLHLHDIGTLRLGCSYPNGGNPVYCMSGAIAHFRIWNRLIAAQEIQRMYTAGLYNNENLMVWYRMT